jgi:hypothetical protein
MLKPYKYIEKIQSLENQMFLESIDADHKEEKSNEYSADQKTI